MPHISMKKVLLQRPFCESYLMENPGTDSLERNKSRHVVALGINWMIATLYDAGKFGYSPEKAE